MIYVVDKNKETCHKLEKEELYEPCEIIPWIESVREEGEPCGIQEFMEFRSGWDRIERHKHWGIEEKRIHKQWRSQMEIEANGSDKVRLATTMGWPKGREGVALVDRVGRGDLSYESMGNFGRAGAPAEMDGWILRSPEVGGSPETEK